MTLNRNVLLEKLKLKIVKGSRELNLIGRTLHYICRESDIKLRSYHSSTLRVEFLTTRLVNKKKCKKVYDEANPELM
jgi:hypothetical protein